MRLVPILALVLAACPTPEPSACDDVCRELVSTCDYAAYPTFASCQQGCAFWQSEGVDVDGYLGCVQDAECNTFAIVECEHDFGPDAQ